MCPFTFNKCFRPAKSVSRAQYTFFGTRYFPEEIFFEKISKTVFCLFPIGKKAAFQSYAYFKKKLFLNIERDANLGLSGLFVRSKWRAFFLWSSLEVHRSGKFPSGRTGRIETGYRPDRTLSSIVSDEGLFSELGNENYEKRSSLLPQSGEKLFSLHHNLMNFHSRSQIQFFDAYTLFLS